MSTVDHTHLSDEALEALALEESDPWDNYDPAASPAHQIDPQHLIERVEATVAYDQVDLPEISPTLTAEQRNVVETLTGAIAVVAGPGAGKTKTLVERVVNAVRTGTHPSRILVVTFTRKAANEVRERLEDQLGEHNAQRITATTFHGLSGQILRAECSHIGLDPTFEVMSGSEQKTLIKNLVKQYNLATDLDYQSYISEAKRDPDLTNTQARIHYLQRHCEYEDVPPLFEAYENEKRRLGRLDYDDMIVYAHTLLKKPEIQLRWAGRFDHVQVDEYQDTDRLQHSQVKLIAAHATSLMVVGDIDQSIFCQPTGTTITTPTGARCIEELTVGDVVTTWDGSNVDAQGRQIVGITREPYSGPLVQLRTDGAVSRYTPDHHCIVRYDQQVAQHTAVYLLGRGGNYWVGYGQVTTADGLFTPAVRACDYGADQLWILAMEDSSLQAAKTVMRVRREFGLLPDQVTWDFNGNSAVDPSELLASFGLEASCPLWSAISGFELPQWDAPFVTQAANVSGSMQVLRHTGDTTQWQAVSVESVDFTGDVVSMEVADHHTYVGDDLVTHNSWRGSMPEIFATFAQDFDDAKVMYLNDNFRSTPEILNVARATISEIDVPYRSELRANNSTGAAPTIDMARDQHDEAKMVTSWIQNHLNAGVPHNEIAVLFRGRRQSVQLQAELGRAKIPVNMSGSGGFYERKTVKDLLAWFRLAVKPDELSFLRVIDQTPGLGPKAAKDLLQAAHDETDGDIVGYLNTYVQNSIAMGKGHQKKVKAVEEITDKLNGLRDVLDTQGLVEAMRYALHCIPAAVLEKDEVAAGDIDDILEILTEDAAMFIPDNPLPVDNAGLVYHYQHGEGIMLDPDEEAGTVQVQYADLPEDHPGFQYSIEAPGESLPVAAQVLTVASDNPIPPPVEFLQQVSLDNQALAEAAGGAIELSTIHAAKGREWDHVAVIGLVDGMFPMGFSNDGLITPTSEERRTMFVAESRARKTLTLTTYRTQRLKDGRTMPRYPSKFLYELQDAGVCNIDGKLPRPPKPRSMRWGGGGTIGNW